jgi:Amt family ammonium transporter
MTPCRGGGTKRAAALTAAAPALLTAALLTALSPGVAEASAPPKATAKPSAAEAAAKAKEFADKAKAAADAAAKTLTDAEKAAKDAADTDALLAATANAATVKAKADEAAAKSKEAAEKLKDAEAAAKSGALEPAVVAALAAKDAADAAEAAATAAAEVLVPPPAAIDKGDMAWMLMSTALVMLMVPGLALFYAGMVRGKNVLGTMMHSMVALAIIGVEWVVIGYAMAFGPTHLPVYGSAGLVGWRSEFFLMSGVKPGDLSGAEFGGFAASIPVLVHMLFQGKFAIITPALISGAIAERVKFSSYCIFIALWGLLIYNPLAHWVWGNGILGMDGVRAMDFAGGTVVHLSAGVSALACILLLGKRRLDPKSNPPLPNSLILTVLGAGLLWFGWFGFNAGSALATIDQAGQAFATTQTAAAAAGLAWMVLEWVHRGKPTSLGLASGIVAGLVGITPAAGFVSVTGALIIGFAAAAVCYLFVTLKPVIGYDDTLDVVGVHGVGGLVGALLTGVLFTNVPSFCQIDGQDPSILTQLTRQIIAVGVAGAFAFAVTCVLVLALQNTIGFRLSEEEEERGLDITQHGESGYHLH